MASKDKYDRQKRLWGEEGANASGLECLKNLVLPGFGRVTIVDNRKIQQSDLGNNFYVTFKDLGQPIAEMNPDVKGESFLIDPLETINNPSFLSKYNIIISSELLDSQKKILSQNTQKLNIKTIFINTNGFIGILRNQANDFSIVQGKPEGKLWYLRIKQPFQRLQMLADEKEEDFFNSLNDKNNASKVKFLSHLPYVYIFIYAFKEYQKVFGSMPQTFGDKQKFIKIINNWKTTSLPPQSQENFAEAENNVFQAFKDKTELPDVLQDLFKKIPPELNKFWAHIHAIKIFFEQHQYLPQSNQIPDMNCETKVYIQIKNTYQQQFEEDIEKIQSYLQKVNQKINIEDTKIFIQNIQYLDYILYKPYYQELEDPGSLMDDYETYCWKWYICMQAYSQFVEKNGRKPKVGDEKAVLQLIECIRQSKFNAQQEIGLEYAQEICRHSGSHLHNIAAIMGGVAAQEVIKFVTNQYTPFNNTFIYDGIQCKSIVLEM